MLSLVLSEHTDAAALRTNDHVLTFNRLYGSKICFFSFLVYPTTLVSVRFRDSVYRETGHTIMNLLAVSIYLHVDTFMSALGNVHVHFQSVHIKDRKHQ